MTTEVWEIWYPKAGATGLLVARGRTDARETILGHAVPEVVSVEVRDESGRRLAYGEELKRTLDSPMARFRRSGQSILRDDIWPEDSDIGSAVLLPGGEFGILKAWWHADDQKEWRWSVEFYNSVHSSAPRTRNGTVREAAELKASFSQ
jgi:hypothetical protein